MADRRLRKRRLRGRGRSRTAPTAQAVQRQAPRDEHPLLALQRLAGNAAVALLVQRQDATAGDTPLDAASVAGALHFYRSQPWLYTAAVVNELRSRLSLDPAGGIDADLAQAVARFQRDEGSNDPALRIDGMAGPRSTPRLFPAGLATAGEGARFGAAAQTGVFDQWDTLGSAQARADALIAAVNQRLGAAGVPELTARLYDGESPNEQGSFDFATWTMQLNRLLLDQSGLGRDDAADLANTVYHEARHSEQWFAMARLRAGQGRSAASIATELGIPARIATAAQAAPILPGTMEAVSASGWYESVYGGRSAHREDVLTRLDAADWALTTARCRCERAPSAANDALRDRAEERLARVHDEYRDLPEENDAWATGPMAEPGVTSGTPHPATVPDVDPCDRLRRAGRPVPAAAGP
jgi:hypothetical protein